MSAKSTGKHTKMNDPSYLRVRATLHRALMQSKLQPLQERREDTFTKTARKTLASPKYNESWIPMKENVRTDGVVNQQVEHLPWETDLTTARCSQC